MIWYARLVTVCVITVLTLQFAIRETHAAKIQTLSISQDADNYKIIFDAEVNVPAPAVFEILADYDRLYRLSPIITEVSVYPGPDGRGERVRSVLKACLLFVCQELVQVEDVTEPGEGRIVGDMVPAESDFRRGHCEWRITDKGSRTHLHYEATRTINFRVLPLIGPWVLKRAMREHLRASIVTLEQLIADKANSSRI